MEPRAFLNLTACGLVGFLIAAKPAQLAGEQTPPGDDPLALQVRQVLSDSCVKCHNADQRKGGLDLTRRDSALQGGETGAAIVPGNPEESLLLEKVASGEMPPKGAVGAETVAAIRSWIATGALYVDEPVTPPRAGTDWWSLRPIQRPPVPRPNGASRWIRTPIDAFIWTGLATQGLEPAPEADRRSLIRRLSFDLIGLPPTPEEIEAFVNDADPLAYEKLVDRLLASPHYGERWGRHWLDVVRFGESEGYETNMPRPSAWPYRDYVIRAFNRDTPFQRFVLEQLAGDVLAAEEGDDWLTHAATGFLVGGTHDIVGNQTVEGMRQQRADDLDDMITATGTAFLGLTVNCARCHDHKFDPITQRDYYGLQAIFAGVKHAARPVPAPDASARRAAAAAVTAELAQVESQLDAFEPLAQPQTDAPSRPPVNPERNVERFTPVAAKMVRLTIHATNDGMEPCIDELEVFTAGESPRNVALAAAGGAPTASSEYPNSPIHKIVHLNDGRFGNGRSWISKVPGTGSVTVAWPQLEIIDRVVWGRDRNGQYRDRLATKYDLEVAAEPDQWFLVASSVDRLPHRADASPSPDPPGLTSEMMALRAGWIERRNQLKARLGELGETVEIYAGTFSQPGPTFILRRGDPMQPGEAVGPAAIAAVGAPLSLPDDAPEPERRIALARWISDPANPLPPRVMVNRLWHYHFGQGIVSTPSDFGFNGGPPSHADLLDWLASRYLEEGGRLKPIHRLIVQSATYRQSSRLDPQAQAVDQQNRLLSRMSARRLEAEAIRDAILACSGQLDLRMGGPGYNIWEKNTNYVAIYQPRAELGPDAFRRMVYQFKPRSQHDPTFGAFDCPDAALVAPRRNVSTTALQALNLLNSGFVVDQAARFADRLAREAGPEPQRQAVRAFEIAFGRPPTDTERSAAVGLIREHGLAALCRALYNANEFVFVP